MKRLIGIALIFGSLLFNSTKAQETGNGLNLLEIAPAAAELSRGEARFGMENGAASLFSNPALLAISSASTIDLSYTSWLADFNNVFGGINLRKGNRALAFAFYTSGDNGFEQRDQPGDSNGNFSISYLSVAGAYAYDFKWFTLGVTGQYLNEDLYLYRASGYAVNAGIASSLFQGKLTIGSSVTNIGEMEELNSVATQLPASFNIGFSARVLEFSHQKKQDLPIKVTVMADLIAPLNQNDPDRFTDFTPNSTHLNLGLLFGIAEVVEVSGGYKPGNDTRPFSFGAGIITEKVIFNYALVPFNTGFGTVHSVGIQYQL